MAKDESAAHALLLPLPFQGHINPFMQLGDRLAALGVRVTLVTTSDVHAQILRSQEALPHPIAARHAHFTLVGLSDGLPDHVSSSPNYHRMHAAGALEDPVFELVHTLAAQGFPVTCIIADYFLRWSPSLASRTSLPEFVFWPQCAVVLAIFLHVDDLRTAGYDPFPTSEEAAALGPDPMEKVQCIPSISHLDLRFVDLPCRGRVWQNGVEWFKELLQHRLRHLPEAQGVLVNSFEELEEEVDRALTVELQHLGSSIQVIGPLIASTRDGSGTSLQEEEVECIDWLDEQPTSSVIFIALGSLATLRSKVQVEEVARGLIASGYRFLWVLRKDAIESSNGEEATNIEDILPHGFLDEIANKGKVISWASQARVLSHPSIGGFLSHCGWNSTLESINAGVPILCWPSFVDQLTNCRLICHVWGIGLELERNSLNETSRFSVSHGIKELMQGQHAEEMHARAIELKNFANEALLSLQNLHVFVDGIKKPK